ncbi:MAG: hypothetical protein IPO40_03720 [Fibrobacteres bacterium]|nr:hypothetical protein [Fibrobacterota bacterium]
MINLVIPVAGILRLIWGSSPSQPKQDPFVMGNFRGVVRGISEWTGGGIAHQGSNLLDNNPKTSWVPDTSDQNPIIQIIFSRKASLEGPAFEFGWKENRSRCVLRLPREGDYERIVVKGSGSRDGFDFYPIFERMTSVCQPEITIDGKFKKEMSRIDVLSFSFKVDGDSEEHPLKLRLGEW